MQDWLQIKDVMYIFFGAAFLGLTFMPVLNRFRLIGAPMLYVVGGIVLGSSPLNLPIIDPLAGNLERLVVEHLTELIVIIALAGAGLSVDRAPGRLEWQHTWWLLGVAMPITLVLLVGMGIYWAGLSIATAVLVAAALTPTDPVLARSVQVSGPTQGQEDDVRVSLTTEAGLNDGLAFPFVYLAIVIAGVVGHPQNNDWDWLQHWFVNDLLYRVGAGIVIGWAMGQIFARALFSTIGDATQGGKNAGLVLMASTFLTYGICEAMHGYGFLAVFVGAATARSYARHTPADDYFVKPHLFSDQVEKLLLVLLLGWLGLLTTTGILIDWQLSELLIAAVLVFLVRPAVGYLALIRTDGTRWERGAIAFLGIRGFGSFFYLAYAQGQADFDGMPSAWRIAIFTVMLSIFIHGALAPIAMQYLSDSSKKDQSVD